VWRCLHDHTFTVSVEHRLVTDRQTDRQTHDYGIGLYSASMASRRRALKTTSFSNACASLNTTGTAIVKFLEHHPDNLRVYSLYIDICLCVCVCVCMGSCKCWFEPCCPCLFNIVNVIVTVLDELNE